MGRGDHKLSLREALAYGFLQGPTELLPVSSSGHLVIAPWVVGSDYVELDPHMRKSFEVALHAGTAAALVLVLRKEVVETFRELDTRRLVIAACELAPAATAALAGEKTIERHLSRPGVVAIGLVAGSVAMARADGMRGSRSRRSATWRDGLALGVAQALALIPGVSRSGSTLVAARVRGFSPVAAAELSMHAALPVIGGATVLKVVRLRQNGLPSQLYGPFAVGFAAAFVSSLASARLVARRRRGGSLMPYVAYRLALAAFIGLASRRRAADSDSGSPASGSLTGGVLRRNSRPVDVLGSIS